MFDGLMFNEFVIKLDELVKVVNQCLLVKGIIGGYDFGLVYLEMDCYMLIVVMELRIKEEIDVFIQELGDCYE